MKKIIRIISFNKIILKPQTLNSKHNLIIGSCFYRQNIEKHKKDKITLSFSKFVNFYHFSVPEELRISEIFFAIVRTKILVDNKKRVFLYFSQTKKIKNKKQLRQVFLSRK